MAGPRRRWPVVVALPRRRRGPDSDELPLPAKTPALGALRSRQVVAARRGAKAAPARNLDFPLQGLGHLKLVAAAAQPPTAAHMVGVWGGLAQAAGQPAGKRRQGGRMARGGRQRTASCSCHPAIAARLSP